MKNKKNNELAVCGFEAVESLGKNNAESITRLYFTENRVSVLGALCKKLANYKKPYNMVKSPDELEKLCGSIHHEGVVAMISRPELKEITYPIIQKCAQEEMPIIILDRVSNANNFGAIIRSCAFFGVKTIVISKEVAQSAITTATYRVAKGGLDFVNVYTTDSIVRLLSDLDATFVTIGTDVRTNTTLQTLKSDLSKKNETKPLAVIIGNEEYGLEERIKGACKMLVKIEGSGKIESLNVAQATSILLYEVCKN